MPLTVITLSKVKNSLKGDLTKWMQEIDTGVYVGNFNSKVRENLWQRVIENIDDGTATLTYAYRNEIGYEFKCINTNRNPVDFDGIPLVLIESKKDDREKIKFGFSKQAKTRKAKKYASGKSTNIYVVVDIETSGLDYKTDKIIEIGAVKTNSKGEILDDFSYIIKQDIKLNKEIVNLTGINEEDLADGKDEKEALEELIKFIDNYKLIGYNFSFDLKFLNNSLKQNGIQEIRNQFYDLMDYVKKENLFMKNYKLQTALNKYGIEHTQKHRALDDARITAMLSSKVNEFLKKIN
ncbi:type I-E CRISPR-associated endoribonuclease Cas2e [uncultured Anaerococcus sp.]|uniref:type I-E CRISPR-associated endoribonuclease Cas2e n=1 Tax=uncultured Anaerococcus sp. TaxID=293428 RepID=UPI00288B1D34|nr:type I-E CRISPR-associated endoribonuclease Cas2e [uncultured Anaerococcus sp.]